jgi:nucleoside-diphosphate-sugar epimerase
VSIIDKSTGNSSVVVYGPARPYDVERFYGEPSKARKRLGFTARINIEEGVRRYVPELREHLESDQDQEPGGPQ